ncbi:hypothetical protein FrEUN1fDRAFT_0749 [Parafrankia sp. EUN1f]|nr:hypothetical protein FrEUN1fDRAFT_0749 [Parafrankia sp. EUN1f]
MKVASSRSGARAERAGEVGEDGGVDNRVGLLPGVGGRVGDAERVAEGVAVHDAGDGPGVRGVEP